MSTRKEINKKYNLTQRGRFEHTYGVLQDTTFELAFGLAYVDLPLENLFGSYVS